MTRLRHTRAGVGPAILVLVVAVLGLSTQAEDGARPCHLPLVLADVPMAGPFTINGSVTGLYPGAHKVLPLSVNNPNAYALAITSISVTAGNSDHAGCGAANIGATSFSGSVVVPANSVGVINVFVDMIASPANVCQGATFPLTYTGAGVRTPLPTSIAADPVVAQVGTPTQLTFGQFSAVLRVTGTTDPVAGRTIVFSVKASVVCQAVTNATGRASCGGVIPSVNALLNLQYTARFAGDARARALVGHRVSRDREAPLVRRIGLLAVALVSLSMVIRPLPAAAGWGQGAAGAGYSKARTMPGGNIPVAVGGWYVGDRLVGGEQLPRGAGGSRLRHPALRLDHDGATKHRRQLRWRGRRA